MFGCAEFLGYAIQLGYNPLSKKPQTLDVPYSLTQQLTKEQRVKALNCAERHKITFRIKHGE